MSHKYRTKTLFVQNLEDASCFNNASGTVHIPFLKNSSLQSDLFTKCVQALYYKMPNGKWWVINKFENLDVNIQKNFNNELKIKGTLKGETETESTVLTMDLLQTCKKDFDKAHISGWLVGILTVSGIVGLVGAVIFLKR